MNPGLSALIGALVASLVWVIITCLRKSEKTLVVYVDKDKSIVEYGPKKQSRNLRSVTPVKSREDLNKTNDTELIRTEETSVLATTGR